MKISALLYFLKFGLKTVLLKKQNPLIGVVIVTDRCNLNCRHCSVHNIRSVCYPYDQIVQAMTALYNQGVRVLIFCGGEPCLWQDGEKSLSHLIQKGKSLGFFYINVVTNGTLPLNLPDVDLIMISLDGDREHHNAIRGDTYDTIIEHIRTAPRANICLYMAINRANQTTISDVCQLTRTLPNIKAVSFNFHTPYPDTVDLALTQDEKAACCRTIESMMDQGTPVLNLRSVFPHLIANDFPRPCAQCVVVEDGRYYTCGRCRESPSLCEQCGYIFAAEYALAFQGNLKVIVDMMCTYLKII